MDDLSQHLAAPGKEQPTALNFSVLGVPIPRNEEFEMLLLSRAQESLWFVSQLAPDSAAQNNFAVIPLPAPLHLAALQQSLNEIVQRHEVLRTIFTLKDDKPVPTILPARPIQVAIVDLGAGSQANSDEALVQAASAALRVPFNLAKDSLIRVTLFKRGSDAYYLLVIMHHIISDKRSFAIFIQELDALYTAFSRQQPSPLPTLPIQYTDYAKWEDRWLQTEAAHSQIEYWKQQLRNAPPELHLLTDKPRPTIQTFQGAKHSFVIPPEILQALKMVSQQEGVTLFMTLLAAFQILLARYSDQDDIVVATPIDNRPHPECESLMGCFTNMILMRTNVAGNPRLHDLLQRVREETLQAYAHQHMPFVQVVAALQPERHPSRQPLFQVAFVLHDTSLPTPALPLNLKIDNAASRFDVTLEIHHTPEGLFGRFEYNTDLFEEATIARLAAHYQRLLEEIVADPTRHINDLSLLSTQEYTQVIQRWDAMSEAYPTSSIHELLAQQARLTPEKLAVICGPERVSYQQLEQRANQLAHYLRSVGVGPEVCVGICMQRSAALLVGIVGILKAGGVYVLVDPNLSAQQTQDQIRDAGVTIIVAQQQVRTRLPLLQQLNIICLEEVREELAQQPRQAPLVPVMPENLAYLDYIPGSTNSPKGIQVTHRNIVNFFAGMDTWIKPDAAGVWLATTSITDDISVQELLWALTRGFQLVLHTEQEAPVPQYHSPGGKPVKPIDFSLFYFASNDGQNVSDKYRLLLEGAKFADTHGFSAVWTPERHFHAFGGLYPNPSVVGAALATITEHISIRAGSVVLPLHHPVRVAEEWAVIDNLSHGRVGISFASGWHANDFIFAPEHYQQRKQIMFRGIETVRHLWRGGSEAFPNGAGHMLEAKIYPQPVQHDLPTWVTAAGHPDTFRLAGEIGANVLTHLLGQNLDDLAKKIVIYRQAWQQHGHGPGAGLVTVMLHTFVGNDLATVRETVRIPFTNYLRTSVDLTATYAQGKADASTTPSEADMEALAELAFERYFKTSGLFGTPESCLEMIERLRELDVDEVACLIDFGVEADTVLANLHYLDILRASVAAQTGIYSAQPGDALPVQINKHHVTHLHCTPSMMNKLASDEEALRSLSNVHVLLVEGEELPPSLANQVAKSVAGKVYNIYGSPETSIRSVITQLNGHEDTGSIGCQVANTMFRILDRHYRLVPVGIIGEMFIDDRGVARGYHNCPELTAERFVPDPFSQQPGARLYRTGDKARYLPDGNIELLGRFDHQVTTLPDSIHPVSEERLQGQRNKIEEQLKGIWSNALELEEVGTQENFFALGGYSLLAAQVASCMRTAFGIDIPLRILFESPTIASLALYIAQKQHTQLSEKASNLLHMSQRDEAQMLAQINQLSKEELDALLGVMIEKKHQ